jgi:hypothetical protein
MLVFGDITATSAASVMKTPARRRDVDNRRNFRGVKCFDDFFCGLQQTAGRVQLNDEAFVVLSGGDVERAGNIIGRGRADGAVNFDQPNLGGIRRQPEEQSQNRDENPTRHKLWL